MNSCQLAYGVVIPASSNEKVWSGFWKSYLSLQNTLDFAQLEIDAFYSLMTVSFSFGRKKDFLTSERKEDLRVLLVISFASKKNICYFIEI